MNPWEALRRVSQAIGKLLGTDPSPEYCAVPQDRHTTAQYGVRASTASVLSLCYMRSSAGKSSHRLSGRQHQSSTSTTERLRSAQPPSRDPRLETSGRQGNSGEPGLEPRTSEKRVMSTGRLLHEGGWRLVDSSASQNIPGRRLAGRQHRLRVDPAPSLGASSLITKGTVSLGDGQIVTCRARACRVLPAPLPAAICVFQGGIKDFRLFVLL